MQLITLLSTLVILLGFISILPQLLCMSRKGTSEGQSMLGWLLGAIVNLLMFYINLVGYKAEMLALGSAINLGLCAAALILVLRFRAGDAAPLPAAPPLQAGESSESARRAVQELPTSEFWILREVLEQETDKRISRQQELEACPA